MFNLAKFRYRKKRRIGTLHNPPYYRVAVGGCHENKIGCLILCVRCEPGEMSWAKSRQERSCRTKRQGVKKEGRFPGQRRRVGRAKKQYTKAAEIRRGLQVCNLVLHHCQMISKYTLCKTATPPAILRTPSISHASGPKKRSE